MAKQPAVKKFNLLNHLKKRVHVFLDNHDGEEKRWLIDLEKDNDNYKEGERLNGEARKKGVGKSSDFDRTLYLGLVDCVFVVIAEKRKTAQRAKGGKGSKNIHAWVVGTLVKYKDVEAYCTTEVTYHYKNYPPYYIKVLKREGKDILEVDETTPIRKCKMASFGFEKKSEWFTLKVYKPE